MEFIPTEARKYHLDVMLRVDQNTRSKSLKFVGEGTGASLRFEPGTVDLGTVLPRAPGEERVVTLTSQSDQAVEVYSLDFDTLYLRDEEVLSAVHVYDTDGYYRSAPRLAGQPLPEEISKVYAKQLADAEKEKAVSEGGIDAEGSTSNASSVYHLGGISEEPKYNPPPLRTTPAARDEDNHQDIVVVGPPLSGVTALASKLSKKTGLPVYTIDEVLLEVANTASETGELVRV